MMRRGQRRMLRRIGGYFVLCMAVPVLFECAAQAGWEPSARVLRSGLYEFNATGAISDARGCPTVNVLQSNSTHFVPDRIFSRFGFEFLITLERADDPPPASATPELAQLYERIVAPHEQRALREGVLKPPESEPMPHNVLLQARIVHPPVRSPIRGGLQTMQKWEFRVCPDVPAYVGWEFTFDWERAQGVWLVEVLHKGRVLASEEFQSVPEGFRGSMNLSYAFRRARRADAPEGAACTEPAASGEVSAAPTAATIVAGNATRGPETALEKGLAVSGNESDAATAEGNVASGDEQLKTGQLETGQLETGQLETGPLDKGKEENAGLKGAPAAAAAPVGAESKSSISNFAMADPDATNIPEPSVADPKNAASPTKPFRIAVRTDAPEATGSAPLCLLVTTLPDAHAARAAADALAASGYPASVRAVGDAAGQTHQVLLGPYASRAAARTAAAGFLALEGRLVRIVSDCCGPQCDGGGKVVGD